MTRLHLDGKQYHVTLWEAEEVAPGDAVVLREDALHAAQGAEDYDVELGGGERVSVQGGVLRPDEGDAEIVLTTDGTRLHPGLGGPGGEEAEQRGKA